VKIKTGIEIDCTFATSDDNFVRYTVQQGIAVGTSSEAV